MLVIHTIGLNVLRRTYIYSACLHISSYFPKKYARCSEILRAPNLHTFMTACSTGYEWNEWNGLS